MQSVCRNAPKESSNMSHPCDNQVCCEKMNKLTRKLFKQKQLIEAQQAQLEYFRVNSIGISR